MSAVVSGISPEMLVGAVVLYLTWDVVSYLRCSLVPVSAVISGFLPEMLVGACECCS